MFRDRGGATAGINSKLLLVCGEDEQDDRRGQTGGSADDRARRRRCVTHRWSCEEVHVKTWDQQSRVREGRGEEGEARYVTELY